MKEKLSDYLEKLYRGDGFRVCFKTKNLGKVGRGYRRSLNSEPIKGEIVGSYKCWGGGGYFLRRADNGKIIQAQSVKLTN